MSSPSPERPAEGLLDRLLSPFAEVRRGEGARALLLLVDLFLLLLAYYVIKTVREPLVLASGSAELKTYASAGQALVLMGFVPAYSWIASRVSRERLLVVVGGFFLACIGAFYGPAMQAANVADAMRDAEHAAEQVVEQTAVVGSVLAPDEALADAIEADERAVEASGDEAADDEEAADEGSTVEAADFLSLGFLFYVWVGIFSVAMIAQFWSLANDLYTTGQGERLFGLIGVGATGGAFAGSALSKALLDGGMRVPSLMLIAAAFFAVHLVLSVVISRSATADAAKDANREVPEALDGGNGFALVVQNPYIRLVAVLLILLNLVNTMGEYILGEYVVAAAAAAVEAGEATDMGAFIGSFYAGFFLWVNIAAVAMQALLVSRLVKWFGIRGVVFALPFVALGAWGAVALGAGFVVTRVLKSAENATDYSVMNTAKAMLWLPLSRAEKYKAKQAVDTFFVRLGDVFAAAVVAVGLSSLGLGLRGFAVVNLVVIVAWIGVAVVLTRRYLTLNGDRGDRGDPAAG